MLISWINYLYCSLGGTPIWPAKDQICRSIPVSFKNPYPNTRCKWNCTELFGQRPSLLKTQSNLYSFYKHHVIYKGLVSISTFEAVIFICQLYNGSISDKDIMAKSGILDPQFWEEGDSCMADMGCTIADNFKTLKN